MDNGAKDVTNRGEYMERMQGMVDGIQNDDKRAQAQSALDEVGKDLGFEVATSSPEQFQDLDRDRSLEREV